MAKIYTVRHGESLANTEGVYQGQTYDTGLSDLGIRQAEALAERFVSCHSEFSSESNVEKILNQDFDRETVQTQSVQDDRFCIEQITSSPLRRTMETAAIVANSLNIHVRQEKNIIETNHGLWEGRSKDWITENYPDIINMWQKSPFETVFPGGESFVQTISRVTDYIFRTNWDEDTLLVTHDNIIRIMVALAQGMNMNDIWKIELDPAGITEFEIDGLNGEKRLRTAKVNDVRHLEDVRSDLKVHAL